MPELLRDSLLDFQAPPPVVVLLRLVVAFVLGAVVAFVYRKTRPAEHVLPSFTATLVLLSILIAMVTQVIGDNVARAFSLVGALSIVRFRTVVRDTQDTAFVIFAVGVGMAVGAGNHWLALGAIVVVGAAAAIMRTAEPAQGTSAATEAFDLQVRLGIGHDPQVLVGPALAEHATVYRLMAVETSRQGLAVDLTYRTALRSGYSADALLRALNRIEGVQGVSARRVAAEDEAVAG